MEATESNRDRVRRLLFDPLGFRHPRAMTEADGRAQLDRIADELAYMADDRLEALARMMRVQGQGSARNFWPDRASFINFAHLCQPLPLERDGKLVSWFASVEGERMVQEGTLVETWRYFEAKRVPPATPQARALVLERSREAARRVAIVREKQAAGWAVDPVEAEFARRYEAEQARVAGVLAEVRAKRVQTEGAQ